MTYRVYLILLFLLFSFNLFAQSSITSNDTTRKMITVSDTAQIPYSDTSSIAVMKKAESYQRQGKYSSAKSEYLKIKFYHSREPEWSRFSDYAIADATLKEASTQKDNSKRTEAKLLFSNFAKNYPNDERTPRAWFALALMLQEENKYSEAVEMYEKVILSEKKRGLNSVLDSVVVVDPQTLLAEQAYIAKAQIYSEKLHQNDNAFVEYDELLHQHPGQVDALLGKALLKAKSGDPKSALQILDVLRKQTSPVQIYSQRKYDEIQGRGE